MATKTSMVVADAAIAFSDDRSELDIIEQNEKEIAEHPDTVTKDAQAGIRKAEAAALLWSKPMLFLIFGWYVSSHALLSLGLSSIALSLRTTV